MDIRNYMAIIIFTVYILLMVVGCSNDTWTVKPEWMGYKDTPYIECPNDFIQVKVMKDKWQCQPMVWWGLEERSPFLR